MQRTEALKKHKDSMDRKAYLTALTEDFVQFSFNLQEVHEELLDTGELAEKVNMVRTHETVNTVSVNEHVASMRTSEANRELVEHTTRKRAQLDQTREIVAAKVRVYLLDTGAMTHLSCTPLKISVVVEYCHESRETPTHGGWSIRMGQY